MENNITIIIPVHKVDDKNTQYLTKAIESVEQQSELPKQLMIVGPKEVGDYIKKNVKTKNVKTKFLLNEGKIDFASQMNFAVANVKTEFFVLLELDDVLSSKWVENVIKYQKHNPTTDIFLPIVINVNSDGGFLGFNNEAVWAAEFSSELGHLDNVSLTAYQGFNIDGMAMRKETYEAVGGLKPSMKLTFVYEFLLRVTNLNKRVMVIPKLGYRHTIDREDSLFRIYSDSLSKDEARWWMSLAKKEYFHTVDRGITYDKEGV